MKGERCLYANIICQNESGDCSKCGIHNVHKENIKYMEDFRRINY